MLPSLQCRTGQAVAWQGRPRSCKSLLSTLPVRRRVPHRSTCRPCAASNSLFDSPFDSMFADLDREMSSFERQVEREVDSAFRQAKDLQERVESQALVPERGGWRVQRSQGRDALGRSYFVEVNTFRPAPVRPAPAVHAPALALLFSVALLAGAYFSSAALFLRNYHLTSFAESKRWVLAATGPLLAVVSPRFRRQWVAALRGERVPAKARNSTDLALIYVSKNADVLPAGKTSM